ncbi:hypothetical protein BUALT_Bualt19G0057400 [Buddleja alternifolia]|uniref:EF-hand domain-containing protein n=1 Tax=Buddleja alternifolia TaxID=168488 RepID=A0AAV6W9X8_9LAMI|nr:hypothetical protein BUALT_Bualt19G0057400 [Buddleja alternifolia]
MSDGGLLILDGTLLRAADLSLPPQTADVITGAQVLELAESRASLSLRGAVLPEALKTAALRRLGVSDAAAFGQKELDYSNASSLLRTYVSAIADQLTDDPIVVAILDGRTLQMFLEDEDDFAMLAENLFTDLDTEDRGKISKDKIQSALIQMGVELGIPPIQEFPKLTDILKRHGAEGTEELGQAQFAQLLQHVLQELVENLAKNPVVAVQHIKIVNGSKLRKLLANEGLLGDVANKIMQEKYESENKKPSIMKLRTYLEKNGEDLGLPPPELDEVVVLFNEIFTEVERQSNADKSEKDEYMMLKDIFQQFAEKLEANPILH